MRLLVVFQLFRHVLLFVTPWTAARQASLSFTISWSLLKLMSIESVMPSNNLILCRPLLLPSSIFPSIRVFSNDVSSSHQVAKYWSFSFRISPSNEYSGLISFRIDSARCSVGSHCGSNWHVPNDLIGRRCLSTCPPHSCPSPGGTLLDPGSW